MTSEPTGPKKRWVESRPITRTYKGIYIYQYHTYNIYIHNICILKGKKWLESPESTRQVGMNHGDMPLSRVATSTLKIASLGMADQLCLQ